MRIAAIIGLLLACGAARAAEPAAPPAPAAQGPVEPLVTDRPTFGEAAATVPDDDLQLELGAQYDHAADSQSLGLPLLLLRYGLGGGFELRLGVPSLSFSWPEDEVAQTELTPVLIGAKYVWTLSDAVALGVSPVLSLPVQSGQYDTVGVGLGARILWGANLTDRLSAGGNFGLLFTGLGANPGVADRQYLASLALALAATDSLGVFAEVYTQFSESAATDAPVVVDAGLTWLVLPLLQLDAYLGLDTRSAGQTFFFGLGLASRW